MAYKGAMRTLTINGNTYQVSGDGLTADVKEALLNCFEHVAWTNEHGQDYVDALEAALYPPATLVSISAVYTQSGTVYTTDSLDDLKSDLVVTAYYDDQSMATVTNYTLSGTLTEGTSVITVSYGGKTTTFNVTVTAPATLSSITAAYTQSGTVYDTDSLDSLKADLVVTAVYSDSTTQTVASTDYTLSGTLTEGTSTITVSYGGKTTIFNVTVTVYVPTTVAITWSGGGSDKITNVIDAREDAVYLTVPFEADASQITSETTAESQAIKGYATLYTDAELQNRYGYYYFDTEELKTSGYRTNANCPVIEFDNKIKIAPSGYYVTITAFRVGSTYFVDNATIGSYLNQYVTSVILE